MRKPVLVLLLACAALAQAPPPLASISGTVMDSVTGKGIAGALVTAGKVQAAADATGKFQLAKLPPGLTQVMTMTRNRDYAGPAQKTVTLTAGQELKLDLRLEPFGTISGKVLDEKQEPVSGIRVRGLSRMYGAGRLRYVLDAVEDTTNARGEYKLRTFPGTPVAVFAAAVGARAVGAISSAPADPAERPPITVPTFHPDILSPESAPMLSPRPGELLEGVDIRLRKLPAYCLEGELPGPVAFVVTRLDQTPETLFSITGTAGADGKFRICDLYPGEYRLTTTESSSADEMPRSLGYVNVLVADRDVRGIRVTMQPPLPVNGVVELENPPQGTAIQSRLMLGAVRPMRSRAEQKPLEVAVPGEFTLDLFPAAEYAIAVNRFPVGWYWKDATYAGASIMNQHLRPRTNATLRIILARDGGAVTARVADKDGNPAPDTYIALVPDLALPDAEIAARMIFGTTDQYGRYTSAMLAPGKYWIVATTHENGYYVDQVTRLLRNRSKAKEVIVGAGSNPEVLLEPLDLRAR